MDCQEHKDHALKVARESVVLLKNDGVLPVVPSKVKRIAVVGPNADDEKIDARQLQRYSFFCGDNP